MCSVVIAAQPTCTDPEPVGPEPERERRRVSANAPNHAFSKRGERGDRDLWGQHLKNLLDRLGNAAAALVTWEFETVGDDDICRVNIAASGHPVYETKGDVRVLYAGEHRPSR